MNSIIKGYTKVQLSNGIHCYLYQRKEIHSVSINVLANVGSLDETKENSGISHLLEHLVFDGTKRFKTWQELNAFMNNIAGSSNAETTEEYTKFYITLPSQYLKEGVEYISEITLNPLFRDEDIKKEVGIILDEKTRYDDMTEFQQQQASLSTRFVGQESEFSRDIIGTVENLKRFTREDIINHYERYYTPENIEIYIVGNFRLKSTIKLLEKKFGSLQSKKEKISRSFIKNYPEYSNFKIFTKQKLDLQQYYLTLSFPSLEALQIGPTERYKLPFLSAITASGQYQNSILWQRLREELNIVYGVHAGHYSLMSRALFVIETNFNPENLRVVLKEFYTGINKIKDGLVGEEIFKMRQKRIIDTELLRFDEPSNGLTWILTQEDELKYHNKFFSPKEYMELVKSFTFQDIVKLANKIYNWEFANLVLLSKDEPSESYRMIRENWEDIVKDISK